MKRYHQVASIIHKNLEERCPGFKKQQGYQHLYSVTTLCIELAKKRNLDTELAAIIGITHDYATYYTGTSFDHATRSAMLVKEILEKTDTFTAVEIQLITNAIKNHSHKEKIDDSYSELLKDADTYYLHLFEPDMVLSKEKIERIKKF